MSKLLGASTAVVGGAGTSLAGAYFMGAFDPWDVTLPQTVEKFKGGEVGDCVKQYFPGFDITKAKPGTDVSFSFDSASASGNNVSNSCLVVNWEREDYSADSGKWKGNFRWLWSFVKGNQGFVMFNVASNSTTAEQKMDVKGVLYVLKKTDSGSWVSENSKEASASKELNKTEFDNVFPKANDPMKSEFKEDNKKENWDFVTGKDEMDNLCKDANDGKCKTLSKKKSFKGLWTWKSSSGGSEKPLTEWSNNFDNWFNNLYSGVDLKTKLSSLTGKWSDAVVFSKEETSDIKKV